MSDPSPFLRRINRALARAHQAGLPIPRLDLPAIEAEACKREGVARIPGERWREPLSILLRDLEEHAALSPLGRVIACGQMVGQLRARIRAERLLREHPDIGERPIHRPVIVVGPMRSGTTRIQRLLACDPRFSHTRMFEGMEPVPFGPGRFDRRLPMAAAVQAFMRSADREIGRIHPTGPLQPDEEIGLHSFSFHGAQYEAQWHVPNFARYSEEADTIGVYREFAALLKIMAWNRGDPPDKIQLLKSPQFTADLPALLQAFPDARLICLSRDPVAVVGSAASLVWHQQRLHSDAVSRERVGREWLRKSALRHRRTLAALHAHPQVPRVELHFDEVNRDWERAMRRVYDQLQMELTPPVLARMGAYLNKARAHHGHHYDLADFGLNEAEVRRAFEPGADLSAR